MLRFPNARIPALPAIINRPVYSSPRQSAFSIISLAVLCAAILIAPARTAHATVPLQYQCADTYDAQKSYCVQVVKSPWRFSLVNLPAGAQNQGPYQTSAEALDRLGALFVWPANTWCSVSLNSIDAPWYAPTYVGLPYRVPRTTLCARG
jgi:hypothetical protein